jgi:hypothetical protein
MAEYEFSEQDNKTFQGLSRWMTTMATLIGIGGIATVVQFITGEGSWIVLVQGIVYLVLAVTFYLPVDNFKKIVRTEGKDISELMTGFSDMDKGWLVVNFVTTVLVVLEILQLVLTGNPV